MFIEEHFLLHSAAARTLYHEFAAQLPIVDYHNHLDPRAIAEDRRYADIGELWVVADPYKHRAMRINGIDERRISGEAGSREKFDAWAATCPMTLGNPLYMGVENWMLESTVRFSFSVYTTMEEIDYTLQTMYDKIPMLRKYTRR